jgi:hypothetical protein
MNDSDKWFWQDEDQKVIGPFDRDALRQLVSTGVINNGTMVAKAGAEEWLPLVSSGILDGSVTQDVQADPSVINIECPGCGQGLSATPDQQGMTFHCPKCNGQIVVPTLGVLSAQHGSKPDPKTEALKPSPVSQHKDGNVLFEATKTANAEVANPDPSSLIRRLNRSTLLLATAWLVSLVVAGGIGMKIGGGTGNSSASGEPGAKADTSVKALKGKTAPENLKRNLKTVVEVETDQDSYVDKPRETPSAPSAETHGVYFTYPIIGESVDDALARKNLSRADVKPKKNGFSTVLYLGPRGKNGLIWDGMLIYIFDERVVGFWYLPGKDAAHLENPQHANAVMEDVMKVYRGLEKIKVDGSIYKDQHGNELTFIAGDGTVLACSADQKKQLLDMVGIIEIGKWK